MSRSDQTPVMMTDHYQIIDAFWHFYYAARTGSCGPISHFQVSTLFAKTFVASIQPGHPCFACDDAMQIGIIAMRPMRRTLPQKNNEKLPGERNWRRTESEVFHETNAAPLPFSSRGLERERAQGAS